VVREGCGWTIGGCEWPGFGADDEWAGDACVLQKLLAVDQFIVGSSRSNRSTLTRFEVVLVGIVEQAEYVV